MLRQDQPQENGRMLQCQDCGADFLFTDGEAEFYRKKEFADPKRCKPCRRAKKDRREGRD